MNIVENRSEPQEFPAAGRADRAGGHSRRRWPRRALIQALALGAVLSVWWLVTRLQIWPEFFVPAPASVWDQLVKTSSVHDGTRGYSGWFLYQHVWFTVRRVLEGFVAAVLVGVPLGLVIGMLRPARLVLEPGVTFLRSLPPLAYFSLLIIWFGIGETPKVILLFVAALPPIVLATSEAVRGVPADRVFAARSLGASRWQVVRHVLQPSIRPDLMTGMRVAMGFAFTTVVAAETINGMPGIGGVVRDAQRFNQTDVVVLGIIVIGVLGVALDWILRLADQALVPWRGKA